MRQRWGSLRAVVLVAMIVCVDVDPFLSRLVSWACPADTVVEAGPHELAGLKARKVRALLTTVDSGALEVVRGTALADHVVLVVDDVAALPPQHIGPVLRRPVEPDAVRRAVSQVAVRGGPSRWAGRPRGAGSPTTRMTFALTRLAAVTAAVTLALTETGDAVPAVLVVLFAWILVRVRVRDLAPAAVTADLVLAFGAVLLTGGTDSPFILFGTVVAAEVAYGFPAVVGAVVVGGATLAGLAPLALALRDGRITPLDLVVWGSLVPLSSLVGVLAVRIDASGEQDQVRLLSEVHRTLERLASQAQTLAGTLDEAGVVDHALTVLREELEIGAGAVLVHDDDVLRLAGAFGTVDVPRHRYPATGNPDMLVPSGLERALPAGEMVEAPLMIDGSTRGAVLAVVPPGTWSRDRQARLDAVATETSMALVNTRLFARIRAQSVDVERRRMARDLHDGVVQTLVHVGFELDMLQRQLADGASGHVGELRDTVAQAVDEVRATVNDLRSSRLAGGLATALTSLGREHARSDLDVVVDAAPMSGLSPEAELQLLRIAQEAMSNAVQHGAPSTVRVRLWGEDGRVCLQVVDDGVGVALRRQDASRGVGLGAMQERARLLGARLELGPGPDGGTCVEVNVHVEGIARG